MAINTTLNEPVAWMDKKTGQVSRVACYSIPLYTTPQTKPLSDFEKRKEELLDARSYLIGRYDSKLHTKPLSDEEIKELWNKSHVNGALEFEIISIFARAIEAKVRGEK